MKQLLTHPGPLRGGVLAAVLALGSCAGPRISTDTGRPLELAPDSTYAWVEGEDVDVADDELDSEIRAAVDAGLRDLGLRRAVAGDASLLVNYLTVVETRTRNNDPFFFLHAIEQWELGTLTLELFDGESGELVWQGSGTSELRRAAVLAGPYDTKLTPTDEPRRWKVQEKVGAILKELESGVGGS